MTISNASRTAGPFIGDGVTVNFPFSYKVFSRSDVLVARTVTATAVETVLVLDADYTVTINDNQNSTPGGIITLAVALASGTTLAATSNLAIQQSLDLTTNGGFYPTVINDALDRIVITIQQLAARVGVGSLNVGAAAAIAAASALVSNLASSAGASFVNMIQSGAGAVMRSIQSKLRERISVEDFGAVGDGVADDTVALQAALTAAAGKVLEFGFAKTYRTTATINIVGYHTTIRGNRSTIKSSATGAVVGMALNNGTGYLVNLRVQDLSIDSTGANCYAFRVQCSYSLFERVSIALRTSNTNGRGFALVGDTLGAGPYYNTFVNCDVQSDSLGLDHFGVSLIQDPTTHRAPNANTFIGGRVGQCLNGYVIKGNGNAFHNPTCEGVGAASPTARAFVFEGDIPTNCAQNFVFGSYIESVANAFVYSAYSVSCSAISGFYTGVTNYVTDAGTNNYYLNDAVAWKSPVGIKFGNLSADAGVLDYYAEGSWTPVPTGITVNSGAPVWTGAYTRIGNQVTATFKMAGGNISTVAGTSKITLPFAANGAFNPWGVFGNNLTTGVGGSVAAYGSDLYFSSALTTSQIGGTITFTL